MKQCPKLVYTFFDANCPRMIGRVVEYVTELVLVLNHKIWKHHDHNIELERVYDRLWREADGWCVENLTGEDARYYFEVTD